MDKQALLEALATKIHTGEITHPEVDKLFQGSTSTTSTTKTLAHYFTINNIFYLIGTIIVILGLVFFVGQLWEDIGSLGRILVTLGLGMVFAGFGSRLIDAAKTSTLGSVFHILGAALIPSGMFVSLHEFGIEINEPWLVTGVFIALTAFYGLLSHVHRKSTLYFLAIVSATGFFYALTEALITEPFYAHLDVYAYLTIIIGVSYLLLADSMRAVWSRYLVGILHAAGSLGILAASFSQVMDSFIWEIAYVPLLLGGIYWSTVTQSRSMLGFSSLFVFIYVSYLTSEYFADSLGWPISLVLLGFIFLGMGYFSLRLNREFIAPQQ